MKSKYAPPSTGQHGQTIRIGEMDLYYEVYGEGQPLLLLHGYGGCVQNWLPFIATLSGHYRLIVADLRGHGYSTNPSNTFTHREAANDVLHLLDRLGIHQCQAMGMSTGAMVLLHIATREPQRISAMVLISVTTHFPEQARAIMRRASPETMPPEVLDMYRVCAKRGDEQIRHLIAQFNLLADNNDDMNFDAQRLSAITARTLIVHGDRDNFFPLEIAVNLQRALPQAALWIIPGGDHVPIYDPAVPFASEALRFLDEASGSNIKKKAKP